MHDSSVIMSKQLIIFFKKTLHIQIDIFMTFILAHDMGADE